MESTDLIIGFEESPAISPVVKLTPRQLAFLRLFLDTDGELPAKMSTEGSDWITVEWIGWDGDRHTHIRIQAEHVDLFDLVLSRAAIYLLIP